MNKILLVRPIIGNEERRDVVQVLDSGMLAQGSMVEKFEKIFAKFIGSKYAIATSSGTAALHLSLLALGIGNGDEVITTPFTFIASANSILYTGARPVFVDIDEKTFNINPDLIEEKITKKTKAILPVHLYGLPADLNKILKIAKKHHLFVIEDACQAHGAKIDNKMVGSIGNLGCFSFYPTKNMTTGEGGMITTNSIKLAKKTRLLRDHGMPVKYHHALLGYNFRMTDIAAAIGIPQLKRLGKLNQKRTANAKLLTRLLSKDSGIIIPFVPKGFSHVFHQYTISIKSEYKMNRDQLKTYLASREIDSAIYYPIPVHKQKVYKDLGYKESYTVAEKLARVVLSIPVHPSLSTRDLRRIAQTINNV